MTLQMAAVTIDTVTNATVKPALAQTETLDTQEVALTEETTFKGTGVSITEATEIALGEAIETTGSIPKTWTTLKIVHEKNKVTVTIKI